MFHHPGTTAFIPLHAWVARLRPRSAQPRFLRRITRCPFVRMGSRARNFRPGLGNIKVECRNRFDEENDLLSNTALSIYISASTLIQLHNLLHLFLSLSRLVLIPYLLGHIFIGRPSSSGRQSHLHLPQLSIVSCASLMNENCDLRPSATPRRFAQIEGDGSRPYQRWLPKTQHWSPQHRFSTRCELASPSLRHRISPATSPLHTGRSTSSIMAMIPSNFQFDHSDKSGTSDEITFQDIASMFGSTALTKNEATATAQEVGVFDPGPSFSDCLSELLAATREANKPIEGRVPLEAFLAALEDKQDTSSVEEAQKTPTKTDITKPKQHEPLQGLASPPSTSVAVMQSPSTHLNPTASTYTPGVLPTGLDSTHQERTHHEGMTRAFHSGQGIGFRDGLLQGYSAGKVEGYTAARSQGFTEGLSQAKGTEFQRALETGKKMRYEEGIKEGMRRGWADMAKRKAAPLVSPAALDPFQKLLEVVKQ
jgi:hypothetical protein